MRKQILWMSCLQNRRLTRLEFRVWIFSKYVLRLHDARTKVLGTLYIVGYKWRLTLHVCVGSEGWRFLKVNSIRLCMKYESLFVSYSVAYDRVFYCTVSVNKPTNTRDWEIIPTCLQCTSYMFRPLLLRRQGVTITRRSYKSAVSYVKCDVVKM